MLCEAAPAKVFCCRTRTRKESLSEQTWEGGGLSGGGSNCQVYIGEWPPPPLIGLFAQIGCLKQHIIRLSCSVSQETHCFLSCQVVMLFLQRMLELGGHFPLDVFQPSSLTLRCACAVL